MTKYVIKEESGCSDSCAGCLGVVAVIIAALLCLAL